MTFVTLLAALAALGAPSPAADWHTSLNAPFVVRNGEKAINVDVGHAAPLLVDLDGDNKRDLLVGQFGQGKLLLYHNEGSEAEPRFTSRGFVQAGGKDMSVPSG
jgi:hypothetical protein